MVMITLIAAVASNGTIGFENTLPWRQADDLERFKNLTTGHTVLMGRKTFKSIGRPLPMRHNVVLTRQNIQIPGVQVIHSLQEMMEVEGEELFVIGGSNIYEQTIGQADRLYITEIHADVEGDRKFPVIDTNIWYETHREAFIGDGIMNQYDTDFVIYQRR
ncbi:dihydrofolate reductase [Candidatus Saccharibacteria bacterium]|nr:dihydrofolate reductase [Candidatus Saccharibacteria bacterium]